MKHITTDHTSAPVNSTVHVFEVAGLGKAPFRFVRFDFGATHCDFCATFIKNIFWIKGSDSKPEFKVGCDCVEKTNDYGLRRVVDAEWKRQQKARKAQLDGMKVAEVESLVAREDVKNVLQGMPHPYGFGGKSALDYAEYMMKNAGVSGKTKVLKMIKKALSV